MRGFGVRRQYRTWFRKDKSGPAIDWLVLFPAKAKAFTHWYDGWGSF